MIDPTFSLLAPYLQTPDRPTLWLADENALSMLHNFTCANPDQLQIITNRYDVYQLADKKSLNVQFSDFILDELSPLPSRIIYRVSKEKALTHYLFNRITELFADSDGELIIAGQKQEGIKTYADKLIKQFNCLGKLKKSGKVYSGCFTAFSHRSLLDDQHYNQIQKIVTDQAHNPYIYSKPGVFGWNKIDKGTQILLETLPKVIQEKQLSPKTLLDLGCGYGWIYLNLHRYFTPELYSEMQITATDNNAAALSCAEKNLELVKAGPKINIIASDCANTIEQCFDLILCNPPFHQGFLHDSSLTSKFLQQTYQHLNSSGIALFVVNEFIHLPKYIKALDFAAASERKCKQIHQQQGFTVYMLH